MTYLIVVSLLVMLGSGVTACFEAALLSVAYSKVRTMVKAGKPGAKALLKIKENMARPIATVVVLSNIACIVGSAAVGAIAAAVLKSFWVGVFFGLFTLVTIIFAEIIPKTVGESHADAIAPIAAPPVLFFSRVLRPLLWLVEKLSRPFQRRSRVRAVSEEEIKVMAHMGLESGGIERGESRLIHHIFKLNDITAEDMMSPLAEVEWLQADSTLGELRERILRIRHSRIPVCAEGAEYVLGVALLHDLLVAIEGDNFKSTPADYLQEAVTVPRELDADDLLAIFQKAEKHLAVVVDAEKKMIGVVTLEDVLEELVGEIADEKDIRPETIKRVSKTEIMADEATEVPRVNHFFNASIQYEGTLGDYVVEKIGHRPKKDESFQDGDLTFVVSAMTRTRPKLITIRRAAPPAETPPAAV